MMMFVFMLTIQLNLSCFCRCFCWSIFGCSITFQSCLPVRIFSFFGLTTISGSFFWCISFWFTSIINNSFFILIANWFSRISFCRSIRRFDIFSWLIGWSSIYININSCWSFNSCSICLMYKLIIWVVFLSVVIFSFEIILFGFIFIFCCLCCSPRVVKSCVEHWCESSPRRVRLLIY